MDKPNQKEEPLLRMLFEKNKKGGILKNNESPDAKIFKGSPLGKQIKLMPYIIRIEAGYLFDGDYEIFKSKIVTIVCLNQALGIKRFSSRDC